MVEAKSGKGLSRGVAGLLIRVARGVNRVLRRKGKVFADRYHRRDLATPTDVDYVAVRAKAGQNVVVYCLTTSIDSRMQAELTVIGPEGRAVASNRGYSGGDAVLDFL